MTIPINSTSRLRFETSLYPRDFNQFQREYNGIARPLFQFGDPEGEYVRIKYSLDDITLYDGTKIEGIIDENALINYLENEDVYGVEADSEYIGNATFVLTNIVIPRSIH